MARRPVNLQAATHHVGKWHAALASRLATIEADRPMLSIDVRNVQPRELIAPQPCAIQQAENRDPQVS